MDTQTEEPQTQTAEPPKAEKVASTRSKFTDEQIAEIRSLRALTHPEGSPKAGKPLHTHPALAVQFGTSAGVISQIVRNRVYKNPEYVPTNDGN